jgi:NADPH:quinone reductase-like Zn-dependent oxidoreductase
MKAIVCEKYGPPSKVLELKELDIPIPGEKQVLVKVAGSSVNVADVAPIRGAFIARLFGTGLLKPKSYRHGTDVAGRVEAVGQAVTRFKPGDEVFGAADGAYAEYVLARQDLLVPKPANLSFEEAGSVAVAAVSALQGLQAGHVQAGQTVLVHGASGAVGTFAVQLAKSFGAEVTAVCSTQNVQQAHSLGADHVIDYMQEDVTRGSQKFDLILAINGAHTVGEYKRILNTPGYCVFVGGKMPQIIRGILAGPIAKKTGDQRIGFMGIAKLNQKDLETLRDLLEAGNIRPVIDRRFPLAEVGQAMEYIEKGHARAKVVITI